MTIPASVGPALAGGRYTLIGPLAGLPEAFLAVDHEAFDRHVAVLRFAGLFAPAADPAALRRFLRRMADQAAIRHPLTPQIYAYFQDGPDAYVVMERLEGAPLDAGPYPLEAVAGWGLALCGLLEYLRGRPQPLAHGGIAPARLLIDAESGELRLAGLIARGVDPADDLRDLALALRALAGPAPALEPALAGADDPDPARRPAPAELRRRLEQLLAPEPHELQAPDGALLADEAVLAAWLLDYWEDGRGWLYGALPEQIAVWWRRPGLAGTLRQIVARHPDPDEGLDAALCLLDPQGYGAALPKLDFDHLLGVDFGSFADGAQRRRRFRVQNTGSIPARVSLLLPPWLSADTTALTLGPGERANITLSATGTMAQRGAWHHDVVELRTLRGRQKVVPVRARVRSWGSTLARRALLGGLALWLACAGISGGVGLYQRSAHYQNALAAFERGAFFDAEVQISLARRASFPLFVTDHQLDQLRERNLRELVLVELRTQGPDSARQRLKDFYLPPGDYERLARELAIAAGQIRRVAGLGVPADHSVGGFGPQMLSRAALARDNGQSGPNEPVTVYSFGGTFLVRPSRINLPAEAALLPDGTLVQIEDSTLIWQGRSDQRSAALPLPHLISTLSGDGRTVAVAGPGAVRLLRADAATATLSELERLPLRGIQALVLSEDGSTIVVTTRDDVVAFQSGPDGVTEHTLVSLGEIGGGLQAPPLLSANGRRAALISAGAVSVYDLETDQRVAQAQLGADLLAAISRDGALLAIQHETEIALYNAVSLGLVATLDGYGELTGMGFGGAGDTLVTFNQAGEAIVWDLDRLRQ